MLLAEFAEDAQVVVLEGRFLVVAPAQLRILVVLVGVREARVVEVVADGGDVGRRELDGPHALRDVRREEERVHVLRHVRHVREVVVGVVPHDHLDVVDEGQDLPRGLLQRLRHAQVLHHPDHVVQLHVVVDAEAVVVHRAQLRVHQEVKPPQLAQRVVRAEPARAARPSLVESTRAGREEGRKAGRKKRGRRRRAETARAPTSPRFQGRAPGAARPWNARPGPPKGGVATGRRRLAGRPCCRR